MKKSIRSIIFKQFFLVVVGIFLILSLFSYWFLRNIVFDTVLKDHQRILKSLTDNIDATYTQQFEQISKLSSFEGISPFDRSTGEKKIKNFLELGNIFSTIHLYDNDGKLLIAEKRNDFPEYRPTQNYKIDGQLRFQTAIRQVYENQVPHFSEPIYTKRQKTFFHAYISPIFSKSDPKKILGILSGGIFPSIQQFDSILKGLALREHNFLVVIDSEGHVISNSGIDHPSVSPDLVKSMLETPVGDEKRDLFQIADESYYLLKKPLQSFPLTVVLGVNSRYLDGRYYNLIKYIFVLSAIGVIISLIASFFVSKNLSKPLHKLTEGVRQISLGNHSYRIFHKENDEMKDVIEVVNNIAENIEKARYLGVAWSAEVQRRLDD